MAVEETALKVLVRVVANVGVAAKVDEVERPDEVEETRKTPNPDELTPEGSVEVYFFFFLLVDVRVEVDSDWFSSHVVMKSVCTTETTTVDTE